MRIVEFEPSNGHKIGRIMPASHRQGRRVHLFKRRRKSQAAGETIHDPTNDNGESKFPLGNKRILGMKPDTLATALVVAVAGIVIIHLLKGKQDAAVAAEGMGV